MRSQKNLGPGGLVLATTILLVGVAGAQLRLAEPVRFGANSIQVRVVGANTNVAYEILFAPQLSSEYGAWSRVVLGAVGQCEFEVPFPTNRAGFFRAGLVAEPSFFPASIPLSLPFTNCPSVPIADLKNYALKSQFTKYVGVSNDSKVFRGVFIAGNGTNTGKLVLHSDDGSSITVDGATTGTPGAITSLDNLNSWTELSTTFEMGQESCIKIVYENGSQAPGDKDGVTLYAYDGGGSVRDGLMIRGDAVCLTPPCSLSATAAIPPTVGPASIPTLPGSIQPTASSQGSAMAPRPLP